MLLKVNQLSTAHYIRTCYPETCMVNTELNCLVQVRQIIFMEKKKKKKKNPSSYGFREFILQIPYNN